MSDVLCVMNDGKYMRPLLITILVLVGFLTFNPSQADARRGFAIGLGPVGNIFVIDTAPIMDPGVGGYTYFQYRFEEQLAFQANFMITTQDGDDSSGNSDSGVLFLGMPTIDLKFFLFRDNAQWDPYISLGTGLYILTEGSRNNGTGGVGMGASIGIGTDYYISPAISVGVEGVFRTIGIITDLDTPSGSAAIFPYGLNANIAFHF
jgi:hypothetical protein